MVLVESILMWQYDGHCNFYHRGFDMSIVNPFAPFDYTAIAKTHVSTLLASIAAVGRDTSVAESQNWSLLNILLLLQAGCRGLMPVGERRNISVQRGGIFLGDPQELQDAECNYIAAFVSEKE